MRRSEHARKDQTLTRSDPAKLRETHRAVVLKNGDATLLTDSKGDIPFARPHGYGLFFRDCRFLDGYRLRLDHQAPTILSRSGGHGFETQHFLTNPQLARDNGDSGFVSNNRIEIERTRLLDDDAIHERIRLHNYSDRTARLRLDLTFRARFEDLFVVKGFVNGPRGTVRRPEVHEGRVLELAYDGRDGIRRSTRITFDPAPDRLTGRGATFDIDLEAGARVERTLVLEPRVETPARDGGGGPGRRPRAPATTRERLRDQERRWREQAATIRSSSVLFDRVLARGLKDLGVLRSRLDGLEFFAAGVPWYVTLFGRDSSIAALQTLAFHPSVARDTLRLLARYQARDVDEFRDAAPGKIVHEVRHGELAHLDVIPQSPAYYGTVDATMLFLILLAEYVAWSGDLPLAHELREHVEHALAWMASAAADSDGDGFLDYTGRGPHGLVNQGWKDSGNAIVNADGSLAEPPIALCEVQGYAYRAWRQTAALLQRLGDEHGADRLRRRADDMERRFAEQYWSEELGSYVLARQRDGRPCAVVTSNAGQVLWSGIASPAHARRVAERLLRADMFSGWGIRTLSREAGAYNPMSYHVGSVWPHDNALILAGFHRYGLVAEAARVFDGLFEAATRFEHYRLPELFCGYSVDTFDAQPVRYPVACSPQAWAAGALPYALTILLGLRPDAPAGRLHIVRPTLPRTLTSVALDGVRVGHARLDLRWSRTDSDGVDVTWRIREGHVEVERTEEPEPSADALEGAGRRLL